MIFYLVERIADGKLMWSGYANDEIDAVDRSDPKAGAKTEFIFTYDYERSKEMADDGIYYVYKVPEALEWQAAHIWFEDVGAFGKPALVYRKRANHSPKPKEVPWQ